MRPALSKAGPRTGEAGPARRRPSARVRTVLTHPIVSARRADGSQRAFLSAGSRRVGFFPGSTIGNFTQDEACAFLRNAARTLGRDGALIVGVDLKKDYRILNAAYNDAAGLTAAFNLNSLTRINQELDGTFDLKSFVHCALYDSKNGRVEMYLYSLGFQIVRVDEQMFTFSAGEAIHTENCQK